jgi:hypothetical protein
VHSQSTLAVFARLGRVTRVLALCIGLSCLRARSHASRHNRVDCPCTRAARCIMRAHQRICTHYNYMCSTTGIARTHSRTHERTRKPALINSHTRALTAVLALVITHGTHCHIGDVHVGTSARACSHLHAGLSTLLCPIHCEAWIGLCLRWTAFAAKYSTCVPRCNSTSDFTLLCRDDHHAGFRVAPVCASIRLCIDMRVHSTSCFLTIRIRTYMYLAMHGTYYLITPISKFFFFILSGHQFLR